MSDAKLMMPLFCNGMFNCGGRRIRALSTSMMFPMESIAIAFGQKQEGQILTIPAGNLTATCYTLRSTDTSHRLA